jgi:membrane protease YdiL (CAAX protease family)
VRYRNLIIFIVALGAVAFLVEQGFRFAGLPWSLTDRKGVGEIALFIIAILPMLWFSKAIAGVNPLDFAFAYGREGRRVVRGFLFMFLTGTLFMILAYVVLGLLGELRWSQAAWQNLSMKIAVRTVTALLVVLILATTEELIFRGFVLRYLRSDITPKVTVAAVLASAAIFSLSHVIALQSALNEPDYVPLLFGLFLLGVLLGTAYVVTGSIACSIGIHAALLGSKVFLRRTELVEFSPDGMLGGTSDLRVGPLSWIVLILAACVLVYFRGWLSERFRVESAAHRDRPAGPELDFRR